MCVYGDSGGSVRTRVVISVLAWWSDNITLGSNEPTEVRQRGYAQLTSLRVDSTSGGPGPDLVRYTVTRPPRCGRLLTMYRPMTRGRPISDEFTQLDLDRGHVWYQHLDLCAALRDSFRFVLGLRTSAKNASTSHHAEVERYEFIATYIHVEYNIY